MPKPPKPAPKKSPQSAHNALPLKGRIISGMWKGRVIKLAVNEEIRPTKDRVRAAVFNMLGTRVDITGATVADVCCGSGAYGLEALSRGGVACDFVDTDVRLVAENSAALKAEKARIITSDAQAWTPAKPVATLVFCDPPYQSGLARKLWERRAVISAPQAWWVIEVAEEDDPPFEGMEEAVVRVYGKTRVVIGRG
ncbi:MAG: 16S rRNA (guanine(966)-N(2))-methyltransferase RsmD [Alphaproteobacteria bacterium CG_4_10_14_0_8_um_filter_53_9]|nr:MAG: 16S rRNA (guanine(966)-N(2))-methyltransferase RsmD [Alphaproteobacteria bacterium CG_4_10_14_0_8_um_filter_53_9]